MDDVIDLFKKPLLGAWVLLGTIESGGKRHELWVDSASDAMKSYVFTNDPRGSRHAKRGHIAATE